MGKSKNPPKTLSAEEIKELEEKLEKRKDFWKSTFSQLSISLLTVLFAYFVWIKQNNTGREERIIQNKIDVFEKFSNTVSKMQHYSEYMFKWRIYNYKLQSKFVDSLKIPIEDLNEEKIREIDNILSKKYPLEHSKNLEGTEFVSQFNSHVGIAKIVFDKGLYADLDKLMFVFSENYLKIKFKNEINSTSSVENLNVDNFYLECTEDHISIITKVLREMYDEIHKSK